MTTHCSEYTACARTVLCPLICGCHHDRLLKDSGTRMVEVCEKQSVSINPYVSVALMYSYSAGMNKALAQRTGAPHKHLWMVNIILMIVSCH